MNDAPEKLKRIGPRITEGDIEVMRVWRMGPWRDKHERWDLTPVFALGLDKEDEGRLFHDGLFTAGRIALALKKRRKPESLKDGRLRAVATTAVKAVFDATEPDRLAIEAGLAELRALPNYVPLTAEGGGR